MSKNGKNSWIHDEVNAKTRGWEDAAAARKSLEEAVANYREQP